MEVFLVLWSDDLNGAQSHGDTAASSAAQNKGSLHIHKSDLDHVSNQVANFGLKEIAAAAATPPKPENVLESNAVFLLFTIIYDLLFSLLLFRYVLPQYQWTSGIGDEHIHFF